MQLYLYLYLGIAGSSVRIVVGVSFALDKRELPYCNIINKEESSWTSHTALSTSLWSNCQKINTWISPRNYRIHKCCVHNFR